MAARYPPAFGAGVAVGAPVSNLDIAPTVWSLASAGTPPPVPFDGASLLGLTGGAADPPSTRSVVVELSSSRAVVSGGYKWLVTGTSPCGATGGGVGEYPFAADAEQLYDLRADPTEQARSGPLYVSLAMTLRLTPSRVDRR